MSFKFNQKRVDKVLTNRVNKLLLNYPNNILPIVQVGHKALRANKGDYCGQLDPILLKKLILAMKITMRKAPGVGLAAPQIGLELPIAVLEDISVGEDYNPFENNDDRETYHLKFFTIINPHYEPIGNDKKYFYEGCLSLKGLYAVRARYHKIMAFWTDEKGKDHQKEFSGWPARIFQHETDHLNGELYIDQAISKSLTTDQNLTDFNYDEDLESAQKVLNFKI